MKINPEIFEQFKDDKAGLLKFIREKMIPEVIAKELCSVQPMDSSIDLMAVADALANYKWATPHCRFGVPYTEEGDK